MRRAGKPVGRWKLEDAKARFSELVRRAGIEGPQLVTVRGKETAVVLSADQYRKLLPAVEQPPFVAFLEGLDLDGLDLAREPDHGRDVEF